MNYKNVLKRVSVVALFLFSSTRAKADILDNWHWRNPSPFADTMNSICFGDGKFVAVGDGGVVHTSIDATTWDAGQRPVVSALNRVAFLNGEFIAVGGSGTILTSPDGLTWNVRDSETANDLYAVAYGNGQFVCCGAGGQLVRSTNGIDWSTGTNGSGSWITFGNGVFVTSAAGLAVNVSPDGVNWTTATLPSSGSDWSHFVWQVEFGNGIFIAAAQDETGGHLSSQAFYFYRSTDGTNWTKGAMIEEAHVHMFLTYLNGGFHEMAEFYTGAALNVTLDGSTQTLTATAPTNGPLPRAMSFGNGRYVLVSNNGSTWYSMDETNWTTAYSGSRDAVYGLIQGVNSNLLAVGPMMVSSDGVNFSGTNAPANSLYAAAFDGTNYVVVGGFTGGVHGGYSLVYTSTNALDWDQRTGNSSYGLTSICHGPNRWIAVGGNGSVVSSPNTLAWTLRSSGTGSTLNSVTYGEGLYVAVGNSGTVITSPDGATWDVQFSGTVNNLNGIVYQGGQFVAVGVGGTILTSPDAANWTAQNSGTNTTFYAVAYGNGRYLVGGTDGADVFLSSSNGTNWQFITTKIPTANTVRSIAYLNQSFWIVGDNGMILQSDAADGIPHLAGFKMPGNGGVKLNVTLNPPASYRVQFRNNLLTDTWHDIYTNASPITSDTWTDTNAFQVPSGFYRVVSP